VTPKGSFKEGATICFNPIFFSSLNSVGIPENQYSGGATVTCHMTS
jgi:hypothetical protein